MLNIRKIPYGIPVENPMLETKGDLLPYLNVQDTL